MTSETFPRTCRLKKWIPCGSLGYDVVYTVFNDALLIWRESETGRLRVLKGQGLNLLYPMTSSGSSDSFGAPGIDAPPLVKAPVPP